MTTEMSNRLWKLPGPQPVVLTLRPARYTDGYVMLDIIVAGVSVAVQQLRAEVAASVEAALDCCLLPDSQAVERAHRDKERIAELEREVKWLQAEITRLKA